MATKHAMKFEHVTILLTLPLVDKMEQLNGLTLDRAVNVTKSFA